MTPRKLQTESGGIRVDGQKGGFWSNFLFIRDVKDVNRGRQLFLKSDQESFFSLFCAKLYRAGRG